MILAILFILIIFSVFLLIIWALYFRVIDDKVLIEKARKAFDIGNYKQAKKLFTKILKINNSPEAKFKLAEIQLNLGNVEEAKKYIEEILKMSPQNIDAIIALANINKQQKKYDEAFELFNKVLKEEPDNIRCNIEKSKIHFEKGDFEQSLEILNRINEISPENSEIAFWMLKNQSQLSNLDNDKECEKILEDYLKLEEKDDLPPEFNIELAKAYAINGNIAKAYEQCQKTLQNNIDNIETYKLLGLINLIQQDFDDAKNNLTTALNIEQSNEETHNIFSYTLCHNVKSCTLMKCRERYFQLIKKHLK